jgi:hypothetical protein
VPRLERQAWIGRAAKFLEAIERGLDNGARVLLLARKASQIDLVALNHVDPGAYEPI